MMERFVSLIVENRMLNTRKDPAKFATAEAAVSLSQSVRARTRMMKHSHEDEEDVKPPSDRKCLDVFDLAGGRSGGRLSISIRVSVGTRDDGGREPNHIAFLAVDSVSLSVSDVECSWVIEAASR
jgi:hypothetical protein